jgi:hypothetical protein
MPHRKHKQEPPKVPKPDEVPDVAPPGASFNTEQGRAAHGMRKDLGGDPSQPPEESKHSGDEEAAHDDDT